MPTSQHSVNYDAPRHEMAPLQNVARTMSSREIANLTGKRHPDVKRDIQGMAAELKINVSSFAHIYRDGRNREQTEYLLDREHTDCLLTGYSAGLRMKVIRRWHELEGQSAARREVIANGTKVVGELAILECFTRLLKPAPSSQVMMLNQIAKNNGLEPSFLPGYAIDAAPDATGGSSMETKPVTDLIKENGIASTATAFNRLLCAGGFIKKCQRTSTRRGIVDFWSVTDKGLRYGKNITSPNNPRETAPHWYVDRFVELAGLVGKGAR